MTECCPINPGAPQGKRRPDWLLHGSLAVIVIAFLIGVSGFHPPYLGEFSHAVVTLMSTMWWGIILGIVAVGLMHRVPKEYFSAILGRGDTFGGVVRATMAGVLLDLCSHGILMVGAKLYERGASLAQVMAFLIASPWNSLSLTFILAALIGWKMTFIFIGGSAVIALLTGAIYLALTRHGAFPENPNTPAAATETPPTGPEMVARLKSFRPSVTFFRDSVIDGWREGRMVLRWLFFGMILAAMIRAFVPTDILTAYFGPTIMGLLLTLLATSVIEVCSEGSTPIGAELVTRANAPGNGFTFLMAGVSTDYTEVLVLRNITGRWKIALSLPLLTVPQILFLGWILNNAGF